MSTHPTPRWSTTKRFLSIGSCFGDPRGPIESSNNQSIYAIKCFKIAQPLIRSQRHKGPQQICHNKDVTTVSADNHRSTRDNDKSAISGPGETQIDQKGTKYSYGFLTYYIIALHDYAAQCKLIINHFTLQI